MSIRSGNACPMLALLPVILCALSSPLHAADHVLAGRLVDTRGERIAGATVFITRVARGRSAAEVTARLRAPGSDIDDADRVLKTESDGTFQALLPAGRYRVAVFAPGYDVALAEINLTPRYLVEILLRPMAASSRESPPRPSDPDGDLDWILRRTGGDALRDLEAGRGGAGGVTVLLASRERALSSGLRLPSIDGELAQSFSGAGLLGGESSGPGDASGRSTRLALRGAVGRQGSWSFDGRSGRTTTALAGGEEARRGRAATELRGGFDYRLGPGDDIKTEVLYATGRYVIDEGGGTDSVDQQRQGAALGTRWERGLGDDARVHVAGAYREATLRQPGRRGTSPPAWTDGAPEGGMLMDRSVGAVAGLALRSEAHEIGLQMSVHAYRFDAGDGGALLSRIGPDFVRLSSEGQGSAMSLSGGDDWRVAEHSVVNYGLGYHHDLESGRAYVVPRVGLTTTLRDAGDLVVRSAVMYRIQDDTGSVLIPGTDDRRFFRPEGTRLGYEVGVERRPEDRLQFAATLSYRPFQDSPGGREAALQNPDLSWAEQDWIQSAAAVGRHEVEIEVQRGFGVVRGVLLGSIGRVRGRLSPLVDEGPLVASQAGQAHYYSTGLRATIEPSDTEVRIGYRRLVGEALAGETGGSGSIDYRRFDLAVLQDLPFPLFLSGRFRVLMAYEDLILDSVDDAVLRPASGATSRVTGGLNVSF